MDRPKHSKPAFLMTAVLLVFTGAMASARADTPSLQLRTQAAQATAASNKACTAITPFYWEIGDARQRLAGATEGGSTPTVQTPMKIASASKWLFGAYVEQVRQGKLTPDDIKALTMRTGYTNFKYRMCVKRGESRQAKLTVAECFKERGLLAGSNAQYEQKEDGKFYYNGGHFQYWAVQNGLGGRNDATLAQAVRDQLGNELFLQYSSPQLAGGGYSNADAYGKFLRKILAGKLIISAHLGDDAVCTNKQDCPAQASHSPIPDGYHWHYSLGHWVEDDGTFSSPGAFGFYPWIDSSKTWYGIIARQKKSVFEKVAVDSVECGVQIRKAWMTGQAQ